MSPSLTARFDCADIPTSRDVGYKNLTVFDGCCGNIFRFCDVGYKNLAVFDGCCGNIFRFCDVGNKYITIFDGCCGTRASKESSRDRSRFDLRRCLG